MTAMSPPKTSVLAPVDDDGGLPDVVARLLSHLCSEMPELKEDAGRVQRMERVLRSEFGGQRIYIAATPAQEREQAMQEVLRRFNGRNASALAREMGLSRATVYRYIKQAGV